MSGNLYQLSTLAKVGHHVIIHGPYDKYGIVMSIQDDLHKTRLIRGLGNEPPKGVKMFYSTG